MVSYPIEEAFTTPLNNLGQILHHFSNELYTIISDGKEIKTTSSTNENHLHVAQLGNNKNIIARILRKIILEINILVLENKIIDRFGLFVFFMESGPLLPMILAKLHHKRIIWLIPSCIVSNESKDFISIVEKLLKRACFSLSDKVVVYSPILIENWKLKKFEYKIMTAHEHSINPEKFFKIKNLEEREFRIGYIGRFSEEKGVRDFIKAIQLINFEPNTKIEICGDGPLKNELLSYIRANHLSSLVKFSGWIPHDDLKAYLNDLQLLVMPSHTEGIPNVMLEGMACGTIVLITPVGAIPDIVKDEDNGFIMANNSPECIASNICRVLKHQDLELVSNRAMTYIKNEFSIDRTLKSWDLVFKDQ